MDVETVKILHEGVFRVSLSVGDALFIPEGWWHAVEVLTILLSYINSQNHLHINSEYNIFSLISVPMPLTTGSKVHAVRLFQTVQQSIWHPT